jgi:hypothetical protein
MRGYRAKNRDRLNAHVRANTAKRGRLAAFRSKRLALACDPTAVAARFWSKVDRNGPVPPLHPELGPCHVWTGATDNPGGYGVFWLAGRLVRAHRYAFEMESGPLAEGLFACHHCDNPPCVRRSHLYAGSQAENVRDMVARGRQGGLGHTKAAAS